MLGNALNSRRWNTRRRTVVTALLALTVAGTAAVTSVASAAGDQIVNETQRVDGNFDGQGQRFIAGSSLGDGSQDEDQGALFVLSAGATLSNVVIGTPAADGVHCKGSCTLRNVTWEDVGEDAATFRGAGAVVLVDGGSASNASDKVFQDDRDAGGTATIRNFTVTGYGKVYRSCGTCGQVARTARLEDVTAKGGTEAVAAVNVNFGDRVTLARVTADGGTPLCGYFQADPGGADPVQTTPPPGDQSCVVEP